MKHLLEEAAKIEKEFLEDINDPASIDFEEDEDITDYFADVEYDRDYAERLLDALINDLQDKYGELFQEKHKEGLEQAKIDRIKELEEELKALKGS